MAARHLHIHSQDNLAVALTDLQAGEQLVISNGKILLKEQIPAKHKFALEDLSEGDLVHMYGVVVGKCTQPINQGALISTRNIVHQASTYQINLSDKTWHAPDVSAWQTRTFMGYHRSNGDVGTANYWLVIPLVFCENRNIDVMAAALLENLGYASQKDFKVNTIKLVEKYQSGASVEELMETDLITSGEEIQRNRPFNQVDGIKFLKHQGGCGGTKEDTLLLCRLLAGYITHPNVAGATVLSLGCQNAQIDYLKAAITEKDPEFDRPVFYLEQQKSRNERSFIQEAVKQTFVGLIEANQHTRQAAPLSKLKLGLECGGSDGFSGISANPALGYTSDMLVALGGTAILSEFPELHGVEQELINRCQNRELAQKFSGLMQAYARRAAQAGSGFESNPSPGNIKDGLITDAIKSAGAAKKGGTSPVTQVLDYGESAKQPGLALLCTPGSDVESTTGLAGSGANLIVFTTGLGTPTGNPVAPVVKVSSNNQLYDRMQDIIDLNTGSIITGESTIKEKGEELLNYLIEVASGHTTPAAVRLLQDDFIPWKRGVSL